MNMLKRIVINNGNVARVIAGIVLLLSGTAAIAQSADPKITASWRVVVNDVLAPQPEEPDGEVPLVPLEVAVDIEPGTAAVGQGIWMYGDETGRVRAAADTLRDNLLSRGWAELTWMQSYRQDSVIAGHTYTVNPTLLKYLAGREAVFQFSVHYECFENQEALDKDEATWKRESIFQQSRIGKRPGETEFFHSTGRLDGADVSPGPLPGIQRLLIPLGTRANGVVQRTTESFKHEMNLRDCGVGKLNRVTYLLRVGFAENTPEAEVIALLGDPLETEDSAGGFVLSATGSVNEEASGQFCAANINRSRYTNNGDGTLTDRETGLMWQRCPLGYTFSDGGSPGVLGDDRCTRDESPMPWGDTLRAAASNDVAGRTDWRVPNIKELESLTELACIGPAIAPGYFPDTPTRPFWSATPDGRNGLAAKVIDANKGSIRSFGKAAPIHARLVRDTGEEPIAPLVRIDIGSGNRAEEGGIVFFPLQLSRAPLDDIILEYVTSERSAIAGDDFRSGAGRILIPAGMTSAEVGVMTIDDDIAERAEIFDLQLRDVSANAWIGKSSTTGEIIDNEPRITVRTAPQFEDNGMLIKVQLDRPATSEIRFEYATVDGTAKVADNDYEPASGEIVIGPRETDLTFGVTITDDIQIEGDERFDVRFSEPDSGNAKMLTRSVTAHIVDDETLLAKLNDSGMKGCANDSLVGASCPQAEFPRQDGDFGRDVMNSNDDDGHAGMRLLKLDSNGDQLVDQTVDYEDTPWACVQDAVTNRVWEVKTDDGGLRDNDAKFTWYNSSGRNDGGEPGVADGGSCSSASCDSEGYVAAVNSAGLCGASDWRLPTRDEFLSLDINLPGSAGLDDNYFPFARASALNFWWTGTPAVAFDGGEIDFPGDRAWGAFIRDHIELSPYLKSTENHVRLVRRPDNGDRK